MHVVPRSFPQVAPLVHTINMKKNNYPEAVRSEI